MSTDQPAQNQKRKPKRVRRLFVGCLVMFALLLATTVGAAFWAKGRELAAPNWLRDRIETRLGTMVPEAEISIGGLVAIIDDTWRPQFLVRDVSFTTGEGAEIVSFTDVRGAIDQSALLDRQVRLQTLQINGVFLTLRRTEEGAIALSSGISGGGVSKQSSGLVQLVSELDDLLLRPGMAELTDLDVFNVTLRYEDERANRAWTIDGGRMRLDRSGDNLQLSADLAVLGGGAQVATLSANYAGIIGVQEADFGITITDLAARDIATQSPAFSWLRALDAPLSGALRGGVNEDRSLKPLNVTFQIGAGAIQPTPEARPIPIVGARSYFTYVPSLQELRFDELSVDSKWGRGRLEGQARLAASETGRIEDLVGQFRLTNLQVNPADFYAEPVEFEAAEMDFRLRLSPFEFQVGRLEVSDQGEQLSAHGTLAVDDGGWKIAVDAGMGGLAPERLLQLWPEAVKPKTRRWLDENVYAAKLSDLSGALRVTQGSRPRTYLGFDFAEADVRFVKTLPHIKDGKGHASLNEDRFVVVLDDGGVIAPEGGYVDAGGTAFIIPDVRVKPDTPAVVRLIASGSATAALSMLDQEPLRVMQKANQPVNLAQGNITLNGTLALPLKKKAPLDAFAFDVFGTVTDVRSDVLIRDRVLAADSLSLVASEEAVRLAGQGTLDGVPLDVVWRQPLGKPGESPPSQVTGTVEISPEALKAFKIDLPPGTVSGRGTGRVTVDLAKGAPPVLTLTSDLRGIRMAVPQIGWFKGADTAGELEVAARLGDQPKVDRIALTAPGLEAQGRLSLTDAGQLERLQLSNVRVGNWLNGAVDIVGRGRGVPPAVALRSGTVDLRKANLDGGGGSGNTPLTVALDRLQVSDTIAITNMRGDFTTNGGLAGTFQGAVNGAANVSGKLIPQGPRSAIRLTASNAGKVFAAAGLLKQARGGEMQLTLQPVGTGGAFDGKLKVADARIKDAPAIAALLNSISIVGLVNELNGDGIFFSEITADFRLAPSQITLREASAVGASMGLSMDGVFVPTSGQLQMQGVISPVYLLNGIGSVFTRKGEGLFGFNYSITGTAKAPEVFVNPLTALAPGMFRNLFRRAAPEAPIVEGEERPEPKPRRAPVVTRGEDR